MKSKLNHPLKIIFLSQFILYIKQVIQLPSWHIYRLWVECFCYFSQDVFSPASVSLYIFIYLCAVISYYGLYWMNICMLHLHMSAMGLIIDHVH